MGHGLPAAVSLLPVAGIFHAMAGKGLDIGLIAREMNRRLRELVPTGHFVAACLVEVNEAQKRLSLWTAGMPRPLLCFAGQPPVPLGGCRLPLGIAADEAEAPQDSCEELAWSEPGWLVIYSDGLSEAGHVHASALGAAALEEFLEVNRVQVLARLLERLEARYAQLRHPEALLQDYRTYSYTLGR
ncbi:MAG: PP2C family protein-serine/threonine phosphatase, partial [Burkholderiales bacterium]